MSDKFILFKTVISEYPLPEKFTFPFYYEPNVLAEIATNELQNYLSEQDNWNSRFGLDTIANEDAIGKMFGVLVVQNKNGELGYLSAVSGKLFDSNDHQRFVPPVFDIHTVNGFFNEGAKKIAVWKNKIRKKHQQKKVFGCV